MVGMGTGDTADSSRTEVVAGEASAEASDCRFCAQRSGCISWGWRSPAGIWFDNAVILRPKPGCRGFVGRGTDIRSHFEKIDLPKTPVA